MRCYLSGWQATGTERELAVVRAGFLKYRCFSFCNLVKLPGMRQALSKTLQQAYQVCLDNGVGIMMDSGVFSYRSIKKKLQAAGKSISQMVGEVEYIERYVDWCKQNSKKWDFYVTVDLVEIAAENYRRQELLLKAGIEPVPVFHGDDSVEYLKKYADLGHKLICVGVLWGRTTLQQKRRFLDQVFNVGEKYGLTFHGLAATTAWMMLDYPFFSVDSSSWSRVASCGGLMRFDPVTNRISVVHVSDQAAGSSLGLDSHPKLKQRLEREIQAEGFDFGLLRTDFVARHIYNSKTMDYIAASNRTKNSWNSLF